MLEHEGQAALFEMGEAVPDPADAVTHAEVEEPAAPEVPKAEKEQPPAPGKDAPAPAHSGKVVDFAAARDEAAKEEKKAVKQKPPTEKNKAVKPGRGRPPKESKAAPDKAKPSKPRDKKSQSKPIPEKPAPDKGGAPAGAEVTPEPFVPRDATRAEKEETVYLSLSDLHPFKNHPFGVRDDAEMQGLVESVKAAGVNQPALVRPREDGGYEIIAGHRRQRASELAGFANMPCIVRNMTDDEAILAMTDDNLRHRERILPTEKAQSLKMQVEAIKHQGSRPGEEDKDAGKRSTQVVGDRNGMNYKQVQRYIRLTELVPDLQKMVDEKKLAFTPAVEISFIRPKNQRYITVSIEGQQSSPSLSQAQKMRELDKDGKLPKIEGALLAASIATTGGAVLGTSTVTTFVESSAGVAVGGRTGLTAVTAAVLFFLSLFFAPIFLAIPAFATAPALVIVGFLMVSSLLNVDFDDMTEAIPAFIAAVAMPFMYSISEGISMGVISYVAINLLSGENKNKKTSWIVYVLAVIFILKYIYV